MSQAGMGAMLHALGGGSKESPEKYYDKIIKNAEHKNDEFLLAFEDGTSIKIFDDGQSCCESRYLTCDDNPKELIGQKLMNIEVKDTKEKECEYDVHEMCFLEIQGNQSSITFCTHNKHNGYYGGFGLSIEETTLKTTV